MKQKIIILFIVSSLIVSLGFVLANKSNAEKTFSLPENAVKIRDGVFSLGKTIDSSGRVIEGYAFVRYKKSYEKPPWAGGGKNNGGTTDTSSCYSFLAKDAKWKTSEPWIINPTNTRGLDEFFILNNLALDIEKWEDASGKNILGDGSIIYEGLDASSFNNKNEVYFADVGEPGAIAITIVWGYFSGPPQARELVEWNQVYDDADFDWGSSGEFGKMDFEDIATHELGHAVGLGDLYDSGCSEMTMYGYATEGETKKQTLEDGDITGIKKLYR